MFRKGRDQNIVWLSSPARPDDPYFIDASKLNLYNVGEEASGLQHGGDFPPEALVKKPEEDFFAVKAIQKLNFFLSKQNYGTIPDLFDVEKPPLPGTKETRVYVHPLEESDYVESGARIYDSGEYKGGQEGKRFYIRDIEERGLWGGDEQVTRPAFYEASEGEGLSIMHNVGAYVTDENGMFARLGDGTDGEPAEMKNELILEDGTQIKYDDPIAAVQPNGTTRILYPIELPDEKRIYMYERTGTGDVPGDGGRAADAGEFSFFTAFSHASGGFPPLSGTWFDKTEFFKDSDGKKIPDDSPLKGIGTELNKRIADAFNKLNEEGRLPSKYDAKPHSPFEINSYIGTDLALKFNREVRNNPDSNAAQRWRLMTEKLEEARQNKEETALTKLQDFIEAPHSIYDEHDRPIIKAPINKTE